MCGHVMFVSGQLSEIDPVYFLFFDLLMLELYWLNSHFTSKAGNLCNNYTDGGRWKVRKARMRTL